jgi:hypothetical protein
MRRYEYVGPEAVRAAARQAEPGTPFARPRTSRSGGVSSVSNLSTGYCPELESWSSVAAALDRAGIAHPDGFTDAFVFRRCPACGERNLVKEGAFVCAICCAQLPLAWNFAD